MNSEGRVEAALEYYPRLRAVREYVYEDLSRPISYTDAARVACLEPKYFSRFFKLKTGISFSCWLHDQRISKAMVILASEKIAISILAKEVGYNSERTFRRAFRQRTGMSPMDYRRRMEPIESEMAR